MLRILSARPIPPRHLPASHHTPAQIRGLRYQRALGKILTEKLHPHVLSIIPEPWFEYEILDTKTKTTTRNICAPDFLIKTPTFLIVIEVKLTFIFTAVEKLLDLYVPVVKLAYEIPCVAPLIITRTLTPNTPKTITQISQVFAENDSVPIFQWRDKRSPLTW